MRAIMPFCAQGCNCFSMMLPWNRKPANSCNEESAASLVCPEASKTLLPAVSQRLKFAKMEACARKSAYMPTNIDDTTNTEPTQHYATPDDERPLIQVSLHQEGTPIKLSSGSNHADELLKCSAHQQNLPVGHPPVPIRLDVGEPPMETMDDARVMEESGRLLLDSCFSMAPCDVKMQHNDTVTNIVHNDVQWIEIDAGASQLNEWYQLTVCTKHDDNTDASSAIADCFYIGDLEAEDDHIMSFDISMDPVEALVPPIREKLDYNSRSC